jgi:hypothetical protein
LRRHFERSLILDRIPDSVTFVQNAPNLGPYTQRVDESLKHDEPLVWPVSVPTHCREGKRMAGVVGEVETTFQRE